MTWGLSLKKEARRLTAALLFLLILMPLRSGAAELTLLHINDSHGHLWSEEGKGGFAVLAHLVDAIGREVAERDGHLLFLHGGDVNTGVPESNLQHALPDLALLRLMGCDAMVLGNHEFDNNQALLRFQESFARFPFLSANYVDARGRRPFEPYRIFDFGDLSVAVLGLTTEETAKASILNVGSGHFLDAIATARAYVPLLAREADIVIVLGHLGWDLPDRGGTGSRQLAEARIEGLDLIVDGHSHTLFTEAQKIGHTLVAQAGWAGEALGRFDLTVREGTITDWSWRAIAVDEEGPKDTETTARLHYYRWQGSRKTRGPIGETEQALLGDREKVRSGETNLSQIVTDSMREVTGADVAVLNGGAIRDSIAAGPVSLRDGLAVLPFGNDLVTLDLSGNELSALASFLARIPSGTGAYPQVSGLRCVIDGTTLSELLIDGEPPVGDRTYRVATIAYLAEGGDGYDVFLPWKDRVVPTGYKDIDALVTYLKRHTPLKGTAGPARLIRN